MWVPEDSEEAKAGPLLNKKSSSRGAVVTYAYSPTMGEARQEEPGLMASWGTE